MSQRGCCNWWTYNKEWLSPQGQWGLHLHATPPHNFMNFAKTDHGCSFTIITEELHEVQEYDTENNNKNKNKIKTWMDVANQLLKPEVMLDWAMIGKRPPATEHAEQLYIHPALLQPLCLTPSFTQHERQIISPGAVCFRWGFLLLVKL